MSNPTEPALTVEELRDLYMATRQEANEATGANRWRLVSQGMAMLDRLYARGVGVMADGRLIGPGMLVDSLDSYRETTTDRGRDLAVSDDGPDPWRPPAAEPVTDTDDRCGPGFCGVCDDDLPDRTRAMHWEPVTTVDERDTAYVREFGERIGGLLIGGEAAVLEDREMCDTGRDVWRPPAADTADRLSAPAEQEELRAEEWLDYAATLRAEAEVAADPDERYWLDAEAREVQAHGNAMAALTADQAARVEGFWQDQVEAYVEEQRDLDTPYVAMSRGRQPLPANASLDAVRARLRDMPFGPVTEADFARVGVTREQFDALAQENDDAYHQLPTSHERRGIDAPVGADPWRAPAAQPVSLAHTRTESDWCGTCDEEVGTDRYRDEVAGDDRCALDATPLTSTPPVPDTPHGGTTSDAIRAAEDAVRRIDEVCAAEESAQEVDRNEQLNRWHADDAAVESAMDRSAESLEVA